MVVQRRRFGWHACLLSFGACGVKGINNFFATLSSLNHFMDLVLPTAFSWIGDLDFNMKEWASSK